MAIINEVRGVKTVIRNMRLARKAKEKGVELGLKRGGILGIRESKKVVPVDTGDLRGSGDIRVKGKGFKTRIQIGYFEKHYAIYVHERTDLRHKPGKQAKYLSEPLKKAQSQIFRIVFDSVNKVYKGTKFYSNRIAP